MSLVPCWYRAVCNGCGSHEPTGGPNQRAAADQARRAGWRRHRTAEGQPKKDFCPVCVAAHQATELVGASA